MMVETGEWEASMPAHQQLQALLKGRKPHELGYGDEGKEYFRLKGLVKSQMRNDYWHNAFRRKITHGFSPEAANIMTQSATFEDFLGKLINQYGHPSTWQIKMQPGFVDHESLVSPKGPIIQSIISGQTGDLNLLKQLALQLK